MTENGQKGFVNAVLELAAFVAPLLERLAAACTLHSAHTVADIQ